MMSERGCLVRRRAPLSLVHSNNAAVLISVGIAITDEAGEVQPHHSASFGMLGAQPSALRFYFLLRDTLLVGRPRRMVAATPRYVGDSENVNLVLSVKIPPRSPGVRSP